MAISGAVIVELLGREGEVVDFTVADGTAISKGDLMSLGTLRSAIIAVGRVDGFAGIAASEKEADDGQVNLGLYTKGIFDMQGVLEIGAEGAITEGSYVTMSGANLIRAALTDGTEDHLVVGKAMEAIAESGIGEVAIGVY